MNYYVPIMTPCSTYLAYLDGWIVSLLDAQWTQVTLRHFWVFVFLSISTERIAECIRQKLPYADVFPADSEEEIERNLTDVPPPIELRQAVEIGGQFQLSRPVGCFIRGAGIYRT